MLILFLKVSSVKVSNRRALVPASGLTPGITRPPEPLKEDDKTRVAGRVHAVVRCGHVLRLDHTRKNQLRIFSSSVLPGLPLGISVAANDANSPAAR